MAGKKKESDNLYFAEDKPVEFISTGCSLLNCVISGQASGGYPVGRMFNVVGDKSTGKTLLMIEACANFVERYPMGTIYYCEVEAAFDKAYAASLGLPLKDVNFVEGIFTVEDLFKDMTTCINKHATDHHPVLYIVDSLDALSDHAELEREIDAGSFGANKAKQLSALFRRLNQKMGKSNFTLGIVSQIRDKMNVMFGKKHQRSGGKALDFFASQVIWLAHIKTLQKTKKNVKRAVGVQIKAKCEKNKVALPFRECVFPIQFGYGVDDLVAGVQWLLEVKRWDSLGFTSEAKFRAYIKGLDKLGDDAFFEEVDNVAEAVAEVWQEIEATFLTKRKKYGNRPAKKSIKKVKLKPNGKTKDKKKTKKDSSSKAKR